MRRGGVLLTLWLVVAGTAIATGTWALSLVGGEISDPTVRPLSGAAINDQLQADRADRAGNDGPVTSSPATGPTALPDAATRRTLHTAGGSIVVECRASDVVYLFSWIPAPGYRADVVQRGPRFQAILTFEADKSSKAAELTATVRCLQGDATVETVVDTDHHGGTPTSTSTDSPSPTVSDDHGGGSHGADDDTGDDHHRGGGSGGGDDGGGDGSGGGTSGGP